MLFLELDNIIIHIWKEVCLTTKDFIYPVLAVLNENILTVQSPKFVDGISLFMLRIYYNLRSVTFHYGVKYSISSLSKIRINTLDTWSKLEEIIWYLNSMVFEQKKNIPSQKCLAMAPKMDGI